jgi:hypothetical protein
VLFLQFTLLWRGAVFWSNVFIPALCSMDCVVSVEEEECEAAAEEALAVRTRYVHLAHLQHPAIRWLYLRSPALL